MLIDVNDFDVDADVNLIRAVVSGQMRGKTICTLYV